MIYTHFDDINGEVTVIGKNSDGSIVISANEDNAREAEFHNCIDRYEETIAASTLQRLEGNVIVQQYY